MAVSGIFKGHMRSSIAYFLVVQSALLLGYFTIVPYLHSPTAIQRHGNEAKVDSRLYQAQKNISLPSTFDEVSKSPLRSLNVSLIKPIKLSGNATTGPRNTSNQLLQEAKKNTESKVTVEKKKFSGPVNHNNSTQNDRLRVEVMSVAPTPSKDVEHPTNISYGYLLSRLKFRLENNTQFRVANNLAEWFPLDLKAPSSVTIRGVDDIGEDHGRFYRKSSRKKDYQCLKAGTRHNDTNRSNASCSCKSGWQGDHCSIPDMVFYSLGASEVNQLTPRTTPRKVINAIAFNMEFDLLEARIHELWDVVDLFIIYESNYTLYGDGKPLMLLDKLLGGYLKKYHNKLYYLFLGKFPAEAKHNGWYAEEFERVFIGKDGMKHTLGVQPDDLFIYTDADEVPSYDAILFLKTHDGYPEPFGFSLRWSVFGFFWKQSSTTNIFAGCTVKMFRYIFRNSAQKLRAADYEKQNSDILKKYIKDGGKLFSWTLGGGGLGNAGWHCSWCLTPEFIKVKLVSAVNADFPRWGSYPEKLNLTYIRSLVRNGIWFDDKTRFHSLVSKDSDEFFAPKFMIENWERFKYILDKNALK